MSLVSDIREMVNETVAGFWPDLQVYDAANQAQIWTWAMTRHDTVLSTMTLTANQEFFSLPAGVMVPHHITLNNKEYFPTTLADLERYDRNWRTAAQAQPKFFVTFDESTLMPWPRADATYEFELWNVRYPPIELTSTSTDITAPEAIKAVVAHRAAALLLEPSRPDAAGRLAAEATRLEASFLRRQRNRGGHRLWLLRPAPAVGVALAGNIRIGKTFS